MALRGSPTSSRYNQERSCLGWSCLKLLSQFGIRLVLTLTFSKSITASCSPRPGSTRWFCRHNFHWQFGIRGSRHWPSMAIRMASYRGRVRSKVVDPMILFAVLPLLGGAALRLGSGLWVNAVPAGHSKAISATQRLPSMAPQSSSAPSTLRLRDANGFKVPDKSVCGYRATNNGEC